MYHFDHVSFTCPSCGKKGTLDTYDIISADEQPQVKAKVLDGSLFEYTCSSCGAVTPVMYPLLYIDRPHKFMISLNEEGSEKFTDEIMDQMTCRAVDDPSRLKEKILISERGLDDRAVEILKILRTQKIHERNPAMHIDALFYYPIEGEDRLEVFCQEESQGTVRMDNDLYEGICRIILPALPEELSRQTAIDAAWAHKALMSLDGNDDAMMLMERTESKDL